MFLRDSVGIRIILFNTSEVTLKNKILIRGMQTKYLNLLKKYFHVKQNENETAARRKFDEFFSLIENEKEAECILEKRLPI